MLEQLEIQTAFTKMLHAIDGLDWTAFRAAFTPEVALDYTSLFPGQPETVTIDTLLGRWQPMAHGYDATQHQIGPVVVVQSDGNRAVAETQVRAAHYLAGAEGGALWVAAGRYRFTVEKTAGAWRISGIILQLAYQEGNSRLPSMAVERGTAGRGRPRR
jgi:hypothetical protein